MGKISRVSTGLPARAHLSTHNGGTAYPGDDTVLLANTLVSCNRRESEPFMPGNRQVFSAAMNAADRSRWDSQWTEAAKEYQRALAEFPDDAAARGGLGFCFMQTKQWKQALAEYEHILKRDSSNVIALSKTAELYVILQRRDDAYKAYMHLAELYSQAGQGARAEAAWQKAIQLSPTNPEPHEHLAIYYQGKKDFALMVQERLAA